MILGLPSVSSFLPSTAPAAGVAGAASTASSVFTDISTHFKTYWWVYLVVVLVIGLGVGLWLYFSKPAKASAAANDKVTGKLASAAGGSKKPAGALGNRRAQEGNRPPQEGNMPPQEGNRRAQEGSRMRRFGSRRREGFQVETDGRTPNPITDSDMNLINSQVLAIKDTGFIGPYPNGKYDEEDATSKVLKAGFRFLTLQVDYLDTAKDPTLFEKPGLPALLIRSSTNSLLSGNSGSIHTVASAIANVGFRPEVPNNLEPIVLYIHVNSTPDPLKSPEEYLKFLSVIARQLNPLAPMHLALTPTGNYTRQKLENELLVTPLSTYNGQVIIMSNVDTSLFRNRSYTAYEPAEDFDFWVNMRVYLQDAADVLGVSTMPPKSVTPAAVVADLKRILKINGTLVKTFAANAKNTFTIAMPDRTTNPTPEDFKNALENYGIHAIPIDIFSDSAENVLQMASEYNNMPYFPKPAALRMTPPA